MGERRKPWLIRRETLRGVRRWVRHREQQHRGLGASATDLDSFRHSALPRSKTKRLCEELEFEALFLTHCAAADKDLRGRPVHAPCWAEHWFHRTLWVCVR
jgi:hypothetical protein